MNDTKHRPRTLEEIHDSAAEQITLEDMQVVEEHAKAQIAEWWERCGREPLYPASDDDVIALLRGVGYEVTRDVIIKYLDNGYAFSPDVMGGKRIWAALTIVLFGRALEARRQWQPLHPLHAFKMSAMEIAIAESAAAGKPALDGLENTTAGDMLRFLVRCNHPDTRRAMGEVLKAKLPGVDWT